MDPAALAGLCAMLAAGRSSVPLPAGVSCPAAPVHVAAVTPKSQVAPADALRSPAAREAIARVAFAEAGNQGDSGLAAVVYAILNRLEDGRWGSSVDSVLNARGQFEPVMRAGGDWRNLPPVSVASKSRIETILNLALDGRLPDLTHGARFFQNPTIVARRAANGQVSAHLVNFGGTAPSAVIGAHAFYVEVGSGGRASGRERGAATVQSPDQLIVGPNSSAAVDPTTTTVALGTGQPPAGDPSQAMFVGSDGVVRDGSR